MKDPTEAIRLAATRYPDVDEGTACTQASFKTGKKSFLFVGMQGGRHKVMLKLSASLPRARALAREEPDRYGAGAGGWVTIRFSADDPPPKSLWKPWLDESYALFARGPAKPPVRSAKKSNKKKAVQRATKRVAKKAGKRATKKSRSNKR